MDYYSEMIEASMKNYRILADLLTRISYKPGWEVNIIQDPNGDDFFIVIYYDGYESEKAAFIPIGKEERHATIAREKLSKAIGRTVREPERRCFTKRIDRFSLAQATPELLMRYYIADTIKQAELAEFARWFKVEGDTVFEKDYQ